MHTVHTAAVDENGFTHAAMGIIFDTTDYNVNLTSAEEAIIDNFFD